MVSEDGKDYLKHIKAGDLKNPPVLIILWLLKKDITHGYRLINILKNDCHLKSATASRIYPILNKLSKSGFIKSNNKKRGKQTIKYYYTTKKGEKIIQSAKEMIRNSEVLREFISEMVK